MRMIAYDDITVNSKSLVKRFSHTQRFKLGAKLCEGSKSLLDYGTGSGFFLKFLSEKKPEISIVGYEPLPEMFSIAQDKERAQSSFRVVNQLEGLGQFDCITCFEVLEHLTEEDQVKTLAECRKRLNGNGKLIISVPIETGMSGLLKNIIRWFIRQKHATQLKDVVKSFLGMRIEREIEDGYIYSHIGFRFKDLEKTLYKENFRIVKRLTSPFTFLGPFANSQMIYVVK